MRRVDSSGDTRCYGDRQHGDLSYFMEPRGGLTGGQQGEESGRVWVGVVGGF